MEPVIVPMGGSGIPLLFAHANGYPPGSYRMLFEAMAPHFEIQALEHRPLWAGREPPRRLRWKLFCDDLLQVMDKLYDEPVWVMGHSMGATIATLAAARLPAAFAGLILLDPVFLPDRLVLGMRLIPEKKRRQLPMIRRALSRPAEFDSFASAFAFYRPKRAFAGMGDEALWDYVHASNAPLRGGGVGLRYSGAWEAAVYGSGPRVRPALKKLRVPTLGVRGRDSDTLQPGIWRRWKQWQPEAVLKECPGGHLFPLEHPRETAELLISHLLPEIIAG
ncbi:MAG: pimeloyl-ACP methyl ester carboxylesterase [Halieaceae bacterium]|jgi:pimeloyl-ACP methyl ester carboxylesterase